MTQTTNAERLTRLPAPVQDALSELVDRVIGMGTEEKVAAGLLLNHAGLFLARNFPDETLPAAEVLSSLVGVILAAQEQAHPAATAGRVA